MLGAQEVGVRPGRRQGGEGLQLPSSSWRPMSRLRWQRGAVVLVSPARCQCLVQRCVGRSVQDSRFTCMRLCVYVCACTFRMQALKMTGSTLGKSSLRVLPSKTAIVPVNKELMPRSEEELERCSRTVYVANIDKKVEREDVRTFFEKLCGESVRAEPVCGVLSRLGVAAAVWGGQCGSEHSAVCAG